MGLILLPNAPNPFSQSTEIAFAVSDPSRRVRIAVYDLAGRLVRRLCDEDLEAGLYTRTWDGRDSRGNSVASGVYFFEAEFDGMTSRQKAVMIR